MRKLVSAFLIVIISSCSTPRYSYAPARVNVPMLQEKNELQVDGSISVLKGYDASAAYAITPHVGIMLNGSWRSDNQDGSFSLNEPLPPQHIDYHRTSVDFGLGYFTGTGSNVHFEIYSGFGTGKFSIDDIGKKYRDTSSIPYSRNYKASLSRFFVQPAFGANSSSFQFIFFVRLLFQRYGSVNTNYSELEMDHYYIPYQSTRFYGFIEPGFTFRTYIKSVPALGFETNFLLSRSLNSDYIEWIPVHASVGIHLRFKGMAD